MSTTTKMSILSGKTSIPDPKQNSVFLRACRGERTDHTPVWIYRQAGRYLPEYRKLKGSTPSLEFFKNPDMAAQAAVDAQRILGTDAAILFADLLPVLEPLGFDLDYIPGSGPHIANPFRGQPFRRFSGAGAEEALGYIRDTVRNTISELPGDIPLIGFAGAPFTLASYAIEGESSKTFAQTKRLMVSKETAWHAFLSDLVDLVTTYVDMQVSAGVDAIQIFDSWAGCLSAGDYRRFAMPHTQRLMHRITGRVPVIYFGTGNSHMFSDLPSTGADLLAVDWRAPLAESWEQLGCVAIQGNLDPALLLTDFDIVRCYTHELLASVAGRPGHIFNLGHGVLPQTPVDNVQRLVALVQHSTSGR